jgi:nucleotide-binding universal stress UspA family protein
VASAVAELRGQNLTVITRIQYGDPAAEIVAYANQMQADLVVLGYGHRGILSRWFQGSVSAKLLDHLPCSLLVATGKD